MLCSSRNLLRILQCVANRNMELLSTTPPSPLLLFQAVCNLVSCPDSQLAAVEAGAVPCLRQLAKLGVPEIEVSFSQHYEPYLPPHQLWNIIFYVLTFQLSLFQNDSRVKSSPSPPAKSSSTAQILSIPS